MSADIEGPQNSFAFRSAGRWRGTDAGRGNRAQAAGSTTILYRPEVKTGALWAADQHNVPYLPMNPVT